MAKRDRPLQRTRAYDIWDEKTIPADRRDGYQLVFQRVTVFESGEDMLRAAYRKNGEMRVRPPVYFANDWVEVLEQAIEDPQFFDREHVERFAAACARRLGKQQT